MLGFAALAEVALAEVPSLDVGPAWRRLLADIEPRRKRNIMPPPELVWHDPTEEEEAVLLELMRTL